MVHDSGFSRHSTLMLRYFSFAPSSASAYTAAFLPVHLLCFLRVSLPRIMIPSCVPTVLIPYSAGISTCCPSATLLRLALGPDFPGADQLYPGILGYSAGRIPTFLSLLIPAFSLLNPPLLLPVQLLQINNAPLPIHLSMIPWLRCRVSAPDIFGAGPLGQ